MKILLSLVICSQVAGTCLEPYPWPTTFNTQYDCLMFGYEESLKKMKEIGRTDVNQYNMLLSSIAHRRNLAFDIVAGMW